LGGGDLYSQVEEPFQVTLLEPGFDYEIIEDIGGPIGSSTLKAVDNDENLYLPDLTIISPATIDRLDKFGNRTPFLEIDFLISGSVRSLVLDNHFGEMYIIVLSMSRHDLIKITGFTPLSETQLIQDLQDQIDMIDAIPGPPGPQGPPGISPEELAALMQTVDENRALLADLPQLKKQLEELAAQAP